MSDQGDIAIMLRLTAPFCRTIAFRQSETVNGVGLRPAVRTVTVTTDRGLDLVIRPHPATTPDAILGSSTFELPPIPR